MRAIPNAVWADFGAGSGRFSEALAELLGADGKVIAVERDARALRELRRVATQYHGMIEVVAGDVLHLHTIPEVKNARLAGGLFANVLHFFASPERVLAEVRDFLAPDGAVVVIEYDRRSASRWVPHPISLQLLKDVARAAGFSEPREIARRASRYQGELYSAVLRMR